MEWNSAFNDRIRAVSWRGILVAIGLLAMTLNVVNSWVPGPWFDEGVTILAAQRSWASLATMLHEIDAVHGLYYALMHIWFDLVGYSPLTLRLPSIFVTSVAAALVAILGRRLVNARVGILASLAYLALPTVTFYAAEGRSIALSTALVTLLVLVFVQALHRNSRGWWLGYAAVVAIAAHVFFLATLVLIVLPLVLTAMGASRMQWVRFTLSTLFAAITCLPLLIMLVSQQGQVSWITEPTLRGLIVLPREIWYPMHGSLTYAVVAWVTIAVGNALFMWQFPPRGSSVSTVLGVRGIRTLVLGWLVLPVIVLIAVSVVGPNLYTPRYLQITTPALALILGMGIAALERPRRQGVAFLLLLAILIPPWLQQRTVDAKAPTYLAAVRVASAARPGDGVLFVSGRGHDWTRLAKHAYPRYFVGTVDLNFGSPYAKDSGLTESIVPLAEVPNRLRGVQRVISIVPPEFDLQGGADLSMLSMHGFSRIETSLAGDWEIQVWTR